MKNELLLVFVLLVGALLLDHIIGSTEISLPGICVCSDTPTLGRGHTSIVSWTTTYDDEVTP